MWDLLFDWKELVERGYDAAGYGFMAIVATTLFLLRLGFALFGGDAGDGDFDTDFEGGSGSDASFTLFSALSILAFFMGAGWMGLAARLEWDLSRPVSSLLAVGFGILMMLAASGMMWGVRRLNSESSYDLRTAVGHVGRVYLTIPEKGAGGGQVEVAVSGSRKVLAAVSDSGRIEAFQDVKVVAVRDDGTLIVEPLS